MEGVEQEQTRGRRRGMDLYRKQGGETVIDYGIVKEEAWERVEEFRIGERVKSDHLEIALRRRRGGKKQRRRGVGDMNEKSYFWKCLEVLFYV
jgi:hypothetical protein